MAYEAWYASFGAFPFDPTGTYPDGVTFRAGRGNQFYLDDAPAEGHEVVRKMDVDSLSGAYEFDLAINNYIIRNDYPEGIIDEFADETGIDTAASANEVYDAVNLLYSPDTGTDMSLVSEEVAVDWYPFTGALVVLMEEVDSITINTDIKGWVSGDNGSNWTQVTLAKAYNLTLAKFVLVGEVTVGTRGQSMAWKVTTHNLKDLKIHAASLLWR